LQEARIAWKIAVARQRDGKAGRIRAPPERLEAGRLAPKLENSFFNRKT
jgi:hypothetical protein